MQLNPELKRNAIIELTPHRLFVTLLIIIGILIIHHLLDNTDQRIASSFSTLFTLVCIIWGASVSALAIHSEIAQRTWYQQKLSALSAGELMIGKLFGSTLFAWAAGLGFLLVYFLFRITTFGIAESLVRCCYMISIALSAQMMSFYLTLLYPHLIKRSFATLLACISFLPYLFASTLTLDEPFLGSSISGIPEHSITWYGFVTPVKWFYFIMLGLYIFWLSVGIWSLLAKELKYRTPIWIWLGFNLFMIYFINGFIPTLTLSSPPFDVSTAFYQQNLSLWASHILLITYLYGMLFHENLNRVFYRKFWSRLKANFIGACIFDSPRWVLSFKLLCISTILLLFTNLQHGTQSATTLNYTVLAIFGLILRDIGLLHFFSLSTKAVRPKAVTLLYLLLLYIMVPTIFKLAQLPSLTYAFVPGLQKEHPLSLGLILVQVLAVGMMVAYRIRDNSLDNAK